MSTSYAQPHTDSSYAPSPVASSQRGFSSALFDLSFTAVISRKIIKVLYVLAMALIALTAFANVIFAFHFGSTAGLFVLFIVAPIMSFFWLVLARVVLEVFMALFRIADNTGEIATQAKRSS